MVLEVRLNAKFATLLPGIFSGTLTKSEMIPYHMETPVQIEHFQPSINFAPTRNEREIKATKDSNWKISSNDTDNKPSSEIKNEDDSAEDAVKKIKESGHEIQETRNMFKSMFNWLFRKKENSGSGGIPAVGAFVP